MKFNDAGPLLPKHSGPPPWLARLAEDATLEATVLRRRSKEGGTSWRC
ncbi:MULTISPECIES: hypothetical protein [unclassified Mesorhizobium]|nr:MULTISPECIES: hypothetical protein [unclassified Mesorhizobium]